MDIKNVIEDALAGKDIGILVNNVGVILPYPMYFNEVCNLDYTNFQKSISNFFSQT